MNDINRVGDFHDDWRLHFDSLESIPQTPNIDVLAVGSNQGGETFPVAVLGLLPQLSGLYLRNFKIDFANFGGHLPERLETIHLEEMKIVGSWFPHLGGFAALKLLTLRRTSVETCDASISDTKLQALSSLWNLTAIDATLPKNFFPSLAKYATGMEQLAVVSTAGLTLKCFDTIAGHRRLKGLRLENVGITGDWIKSIRKCDSLEVVTLEGSPEIRSHELVELAHLPHLTLRWLDFDHAKEPAEKLRELKIKWNEIKKAKFGTVDGTDRY